MEHNNPFLESMLKLSKIHVLYSQTSNDGSQSNNPFLGRHTFNDEKLFIWAQNVSETNIFPYLRQKNFTMPKVDIYSIAEIIIATLKKVLARTNLKKKIPGRFGRMRQAVSCFLQRHETRGKLVMIRYSIDLNSHRSSVGNV